MLWEINKEHLKVLIPGNWAQIMRMREELKIWACKKKDVFYILSLNDYSSFFK